MHGLGRVAVVLHHGARKMAWADRRSGTYGWSITTCLPDGRSREPSVATGTVMRPATLLRYAAEAGFADVEILPVENHLFRSYRLRA